MSGGLAGVSVCQQRVGRGKPAGSCRPLHRRRRGGRSCRDALNQPPSSQLAHVWHQMRSLEILQKSFEKSGRSLKVEKGEAKEEKEAGAGERSCRDAVSSPTNLLPKLPFGLNSRTSTYNHSTIKQELDKKTCSGPDVFVLCSSGHKKTSKVLPETYSYKKQTVSST